MDSEKLTYPPPGGNGEKSAHYPYMQGGFKLKDGYLHISKVAAASQLYFFLFSLLEKDIVITLPRFYQNN